MAGEVLLTISRDEAERARLESEFKYQLDRQSDMVSSRREGERIGLEKGMLKERREIARRAKALGLSPDQIAAITGLDPGEAP
jgi:predicted transposase YdaD